MDTEEQKRRVPWIEKQNGDVALKQERDIDRALHYYSKCLFSIKMLFETDEVRADTPFVEKAVEEVEIPANLNMAYCYLQQ